MQKRDVEKLAQRGLALRIDAGIGDLMTRAEMANLALENIKSKSKKLGWTKAMLVARIIEQMNTLKTEMRGVVEALIQTSAQVGYMAATAEDTQARFVWQTTSDNICPDCMELHGETHTMEEWILIGLPGNGQTVCRTYCKCMLLPEDQVLSVPVRIVREPGLRGGKGRVVALQLHKETEK